MDAQRFIDAIVDDPTPLDWWEIYADWLLERGDPRGELIALELAVDAGRGTKEMKQRIGELKHDEARLLSPRLFDQSHLYRFEFRRGFIRSAVLQGTGDDQPTVEAINALFADPHGCLVESLALGPFGNREHAVAVLAAPRRALRSLSSWDGDDRTDWLAASPGALRSLSSWGGKGSTDRLAVAAPWLEWLQIGEPPGEQTHLPLVHPTLSTLSTSANACWAIRAGAFELPMLETLELTPGFAGLRGVDSIWSRPPSRLTRLKLDMFMSLIAIDGDVAEAESLENLGRAPIAAQLRYFEASHVGDATLEQLLASASQLRHLEHLKLGLLLWQQSSAERRALRDAVVAAFPTTNIEADWGLVPPPPQPEVPPKVIDADSKGPDGRVDPFGAFLR